MGDVDFVIVANTKTHFIK